MNASLMHTTESSNRMTTPADRVEINAVESTKAPHTSPSRSDPTVAAPMATNSAKAIAAIVWITLMLNTEATSVDIYLNQQTYSVRVGC